MAKVIGHGLVDHALFAVTYNTQLKLPNKATYITLIMDEVIKTTS